MTDTTTTPPAPVKPGYMTTEFWLKVAAIALSALFASGVIPTSGPAATIAAMAATMLGALGYTVSRTLVKNAAAAVLVLLLGLAAASSLTACAAAKADAKAIEAGVVTCAKGDVPAAKSLGLQLGTEALGGLLAGKTEAQIWAQVSADAEAASKTQGLAVASCAFGPLVADLDRLLHPAPAPGVAAQGLTARAEVDPLAGGRAALAAFQGRHGITRIDQ